MTSFSHRPGTVTYPQMERQDLTQSQLGSFKFTPTDEVSPRFPSNTPYFASPQLPKAITNHQHLPQGHHHLTVADRTSYSMSTDDVSLDKGSDAMPTYASLYTEYGNGDPSLFERYLGRTLLEHGKGDPEFFERHLKNDLVNARLRLGPSVVRAAVNGTSPTSRRALHDWEIHRSMPGSNEPNSSSSIFVPQHLQGSCELTPTMSGFPTSTYEEVLNDNNSTNQASLLRALVSEQELHTITKATLKHTLDALKKSQQEVDSLLSQNRSLTGSNEMLKGIVQYNVKKEQKEAVDIPTYEQVEAEVARFHAEVRQASKNVPQSILYDCHGPSEYSHTVRPDLSIAEQTPLYSGTTRGTAHYEEDFSKIYDFDLLPKTNVDHNQIVRGNTASSPKNIQSEQRQDFIPTVHHSAVDTTQECVFKDSEEHFGKDITNRKQATHTASPKALKLELPASFLEKYQKPKANREPRSVNDRYDEYWYLGVSRSSDTHEDPDISTAKRSPKPFIISQQVLGTKLSGVQEKTGAKSELVMMTMPYDPQIHWKVTPFTPIFVDDDDKTAHLGLPRRSDNATPFRDHPVRYMPNKVEKHMFRTVMIDFIPTGTRYVEVMEQVRGGPLESIQLFNPIGTANDFMTARVVFNYELDAQTLYKYGQDPGIDIGGERVRVWQVLEATYPKNKQLEKDVFDDGFTRLLLMDGVSEAVDTELPFKLADQLNAGFIITIGLSHDGLRMIEFTSVAECAKAMRKLIADPDFAGASFDFEQDPCEIRQ